MPGLLHTLKYRIYITLCVCLIKSTMALIDVRYDFVDAFLESCFRDMYFAIKLLACLESTPLRLAGLRLSA